MIDLRALTLIRPMSAAIVHGSKRIENRPQDLPKAMRGVETVVAVHAGKGWDERYMDVVCAIDGDNNFISAPSYAGEKLKHEGIVGLMLLSGRVFVSPRAESHHLGDSTDRWFSGPYGYEIKAAIAFPGPIPCRGMLGFWRVPAQLIEDNLYAFRDGMKALGRML